MTEQLKEISEIEVNLGSNLTNRIQNVNDYAMFMSALKVYIIDLSPAVSDLRLLGSDPQRGLGELWFPPLQLDSSIIPEKVILIVYSRRHDLIISMVVQAGSI